MEQVAQDLQAAAGSPILPAMAKATLAVERVAKKKAPRDRGRLRASITPEIKTLQGRTVQGVIGSNLKYAPYHELGTRPFWPPWKPLFQWARRKTKGNLKAAGALAAGARRAIARRGIKALRYLQGALEDRTQQIITILNRAVNDITRK
jgi:hypothetical protein